LSFDEDKLLYEDLELNISNTESEYLLIQKEKDGVLSFAISAKKGFLLNTPINQSFLSINFKILEDGENNFAFSNINILEDANNSKVIDQTNLDVIGAKISFKKPKNELPQTGIYYKSPFFIFSMLFISIMIIFFICFVYEKKLEKLNR